MMKMTALLPLPLRGWSDFNPDSSFDVIVDSDDGGTEVVFMAIPDLYSSTLADDDDLSDDEDDVLLTPRSVPRPA